MRLHIIPILCLLGLPIVLATDQALSPDYIEYQEVNIYPYQGIYLECKDKNPPKHVPLIPLDKREYYVKNPLEEMASSLKTARETKKLKDDFPELKVFSTEEDHALYYTAPGKRKNVERIYFECIDAASGSTNIIQLNIMPERKYLPKEERIIFDELPVPKGKNFIYFKFAKPGVKIVTECKNSELVLNDGRGVSVKKPEAKAYTNPVTMIEYQDITDYVTKHTATKNTHIIDLMDGRVANIKKVDDLLIYCEGKPDNKVVYTSPYMDEIHGLNAYYQPKNVLDDGSMKIIQVKTEGETQISVDVPPDSLVPKDCLNDVFTSTGEMVKLSNIVSNPKLARITDSFKILDLSHASSYREITVSCYINGSRRGQKNLWMNLTISPLCNFYDPQALDSDGKTCTVFASSRVESLVATPMDSIESPETFEMEEAFFTKSDDLKGTCKDCHYKKIEVQKDDISVSINFNEIIQYIKVKDGVIRHNPVYMLRKEEVKGGKEVLNPTHIMRMYLYNHEADIDEHGKVTVEKKHQVKSVGKSTFYRVQPGGRKRIAISCKDIFEDSGSSGYTLFPSGKNTIFENVSDGAVDPRTIKTIQFEQEFASMGISILKKPEIDVDLQLIFDEDRLIQNEHAKPIYFICAQNVEWKDNEKPYAIIAIDPEYKSEKLQGCGVKSGMFLGQGESSITGNHCMHTVDDETKIGFHCPSYVPEHFLEGDQSKLASAEDAEVGNPYQLLLRCYDRSSVSQRMFKPMTDLELFSRPKFAGELRSLWVFDRNTFAEKKHLTDILCTCYDKTGKAISHIKIKNNSNKATDSL